MVVLVAKEAFPYAGRSLVVGEIFSANEKDADTLKLIGRAEDATPTLVRKDLTPGQEPRVKRAYRRKVLKTEPTE